ncbi:hypothetical protein H9P43_004909 [Blastocladiella emersonii ATCC 22665]|nr:hypothetical protein H9P43_004909 [Blastocladiella emersonii ATCC 22665]
MDGTDVTTTRSIAEQSVRIKNILTDDKDESEDPIPLPMVSETTLNLVIKWIEHRLGNANQNMAKGKKGATEAALPCCCSAPVSPWEIDFFAELPHASIADLVNASHYLDIELLFDLGCKMLACHLNVCGLEAKFETTNGEFGYSRDKRTHQSFMKGNCIAFPQNTQSILEAMLPHAESDMTDTVHVLLVGSNTSLTPEMKKMLTVRRHVVLAALRWLKEHNPSYADIIMDMDRIDVLPEDGMLPGTESRATRVDNAEFEASERSGVHDDNLPAEDLASAPPAQMVERLIEP